LWNTTSSRRVSSITVGETCFQAVAMPGSQALSMRAWSLPIIGSNAFT